MIRKLVVSATEEDGPDALHGHYYGPEYRRVLYDLLEEMRADIKYDRAKRTTEDWRKWIYDALRDDEIPVP